MSYSETEITPDLTVQPLLAFELASGHRVYPTGAGGIACALCSESRLGDLSDTCEVSDDERADYDAIENDELTAAEREMRARYDDEDTFFDHLAEDVFWDQRSRVDEIRGFHQQAEDDWLDAAYEDRMEALHSDGVGWE